jgi:hypothetical protein
MSSAALPFAYGRDVARESKGSPVMVYLPVCKPCHCSRSPLRSKGAAPGFTQERGMGNRSVLSVTGVVKIEHRLSQTAVTIKRTQEVITQQKETLYAEQAAKLDAVEFSLLAALANARLAIHPFRVTARRTSADGRRRTTDYRRALLNAVTCRRQAREHDGNRLLRACPHCPRRFAIAPECAGLGEHGCIR